MMGKRADERRMIKKSQASQPDRVHWVLETLGSESHFNFAEHEDLDDYETAPTVSAVSQELSL
jgi:hypothetical protein